MIKTATVAKRVSVPVKKSGWKRMAEIAEQSMNQNNYTIEDVRKDLREIRDSY
ncbi:hypothetical protein [Halalkalibacter urbisdiaboli]|uniref:hypothetical protein n=1 Tax=Halalkalibacter urbisdiaboli TaxID=1960589 RepID=UPI0013FE3C74|nr:hypothetical protein [Halalkalibacter urbisdiaboli]